MKIARTNKQKIGTVYMYVLNLISEIVEEHPDLEWALVTQHGLIQN